MNTDSDNPKAEEAVATVLPGILEGRGLALVMTAVFVVLADWLFYSRVLGWTVGMYGFLLGLVAALGGGRRGGGWQAWLLEAGVLGLCARCVVEPGRPALVLGTVCIVTLALTLREGWQGNALTWVMRWVGFVFHGVLRAAYAGCISVLLLSAACLGPKRVRGWLIPAALGALFVGLFAGANPIIANGLNGAWQVLVRFSANLPSASRILFWLVMGAAVWAMLRYRPGVLQATLPDLDGGLPHDFAGFLTPTVIRNALILFNVLFAVQTGLDVWYLWGGAVLPQDLTYAEYAQRGAYPLVAAALLAAAFVLTTFRAGVMVTPELDVARRLVYLWLLQNVFLVVSAGWRLWLYVNAYSLSRLRVAAGIWMVLVACGLVWILVRIRTGRTNLWLINANALTVVATLYATAWTGIDPWVAEFNVRHCTENGTPNAPSIDLGYLERLGYDALPALTWLEQQAHGARKSAEMRDLISTLTSRLDEDLRDWRGWTWRRARIRAAGLGTKDREEPPCSSSVTPARSTPSQPELAVTHTADRTRIAVEPGSDLEEFLELVTCWCLQTEAVMIDMDLHLGSRGIDDKGVTRGDVEGAVARLREIESEVAGAAKPAACRDITGALLRLSRALRRQYADLLGRDDRGRQGVPGVAEHTGALRAAFERFEVRWPGGNCVAPSAPDPVFTEKDHEVRYQAAMALMKARKYNQAYQILASLARLNPQPGVLQVRMADCLTRLSARGDEVVEGVEDTHEAATRLLEVAMGRGRYSPACAEAFAKWRTLLQLDWHGASSYSDTPNWDYNKKRFALIMTIEAHVQTHPADEWARAQKQALLSLPNIAGGGLLGNSSLSLWGALFASDFLEPVGAVVVGNPDGRAGDAADEARWLAALHAELYRLWSQPSRVEVGDCGLLTVNVTLRITSTGHVQAHITEPSRVLPMTASVERLLDRLSTLPAPKSFGLDGPSRTVAVRFELTP